MDAVVLRRDRNVRGRMDEPENGRRCTGRAWGLSGHGGRASRQGAVKGSCQPLLVWFSGLNADL